MTFNLINIAMQTKTAVIVQSEKGQWKELLA